MPTFPPLFLSHGAPNMGLRDLPVREFLSQLGQAYQKPEAIVAISAHFESQGTIVVIYGDSLLFKQCRYYVAC